MNRISRTLTTIYRTELLIKQRRLAVIQQQAILLGVAGLAVLAGLILLNFALYFLLAARLSPAGAAGILAFVNLLLAALLALAATRADAEKEIAPALEVRDMAIADLEGEIEDATKEVREIVDAVKGVRTDPLSSLTTLLVPILTAATKKKDS